MSVLVFGGAFNPVHLGHLICARAAAEACGFSRVLLMPTASPPHRDASDLASAADRIALCRLATAGDPLFAVDPLETTLEPPSYSLRTARILKERPEFAGRVSWLIGTDQLRALHQWWHAEELLHEVEFVVMRRAGETIDPHTLPEPTRPLVERLVEVPAIEISATAIRERIRAGRPISYLVPPAVERCIADRGLYGGGS